MSKSVRQKKPLSTRVDRQNTNGVLSALLPQLLASNSSSARGLRPADDASSARTYDGGQEEGDTQDVNLAALASVADRCTPNDRRRLRFLAFVLLHSVGALPPGVISSNEAGASPKQPSRTHAGPADADSQVKTRDAGQEQDHTDDDDDDDDDDADDMDRLIPHWSATASVLLYSTIARRGLLAATADGMIHRSTDGGSTWRAVTPAAAVGGGIVGVGTVGSGGGSSSTTTTFVPPPPSAASVARRKSDAAPTADDNLLADIISSLPPRAQEIATGAIGRDLRRTRPVGDSAPHPTTAIVPPHPTTGGAFGEPSLMASCASGRRVVCVAKVKGSRDSPPQFALSDNFGTRFDILSGIEADGGVALSAIDVRQVLFLTDDVIVVVLVATSPQSTSPAAAAAALYYGLWSDLRGSPSGAGRLRLRVLRQLSDSSPVTLAGSNGTTWAGVLRTAAASHHPGAPWTSWLASRCSMDATEARKLPPNWLVEAAFAGSTGMVHFIAIFVKRPSRGTGAAPQVAPSSDCVCVEAVGIPHSLGALRCVIEIPNRGPTMLSGDEIPDFVPLSVATTRKDAYGRLAFSEPPMPVDVQPLVGQQQDTKSATFSYASRAGPLMSDAMSSGSDAQGSQLATSFLASLGTSGWPTKWTVPRRTIPHHATVSHDNTHAAGGRLFAVYASNGQLLPYDCTALLHVRHDEPHQAAPTPDARYVTVCPSNVDYVPFVCTPLADDVGLSVLPAPPPPATVERTSANVSATKTCCPWRIVRSNASGLSVSRDWGATWEDPVAAYTKSLIAWGSVVQGRNCSSACAITGKRAIIIGAWDGQREPYSADRGVSRRRGAAAAVKDYFDLVTQRQAVPKKPKDALRADSLAVPPEPQLTWLTVPVASSRDQHQFVVKCATALD
mgnify:FL=1